MKKFRNNLQAINALKIMKDSSIFGLSLLAYLTVPGLIMNWLENLSFLTKVADLIVYLLGFILSMVLFFCISRHKSYKFRISRIIVNNSSIKELLSIGFLDFTIKFYILIIFVIINYLILSKVGINIIPSTSSSFDNLLIICILGPISEELIFRGIGLGILRKYGQKTAIIFVSIIFGLCHGNIMQAFCAGISGIVLSYVYFKYGLIYSILLHMLNNFLPSVISISKNNIFIAFVILLAIIYIGSNILYNNANNIKNYLTKGIFDLKTCIIQILNPFIVTIIILSVQSIIENIEFV